MANNKDYNEEFVEYGANNVRGYGQNTAEYKAVNAQYHQEEDGARYAQQGFYHQDDQYDDYDDYDDDYDDEEDEEEYDRMYGVRRFFSSIWGKLAALLILLLVTAIVVLLVWRSFSDERVPLEFSEEPMTLPAVQDEMQEPGAIVFAPATAEPTDAPSPTPRPTPTYTPVPTDTPEPTATPLPIILTNTPTPSPSPTASPTPTPSPSPTPSPKPTPTPRVDLAGAVTNREAKLRESASASGKIKKTLKKGEDLTIHEAVLDKSGKVWYFVSVNDLDTQGWMRDYVVDVDGQIAAPTATPSPSATPKASDAQQNTQQTPEPTTAGIGSGVTNKDANVRKIMNGKVITQLRKGRAVIILDAKLDKNGDLWYEIQVKGQTTKGFVRDYLITLDQGIKIEKPTPAPEAKEESVSTEITAELLDREVIGKAMTNRKANMRVKPVSGAKIAVQLAKNAELKILDMFTENKNIWYEVITADGKQYGFVRDYVVDVETLKEGLKAKNYTDIAAPTK